MKNELWTKLFGYPVNREMKEKTLEEMKETGDPIEKVIARYTLPTMAILGPDGRFDDMPTGKRMTPEEWHKSNPLGEYGKLIIVKL